MYQNENLPDEGRRVRPLETLMALGKAARGPTPSLVWMVWLCVTAAHGQQLLDEVSFRNSAQNGFHLTGASIYSGYSTSAYPQAGYSLNSSSSQGIGSLGSDESYGASASVGWQHHRGKANYSALYTGTYEGMVHYSGLNAYNQSLFLSASWELTRKWTLTFSATGEDNNLAQYLFQPAKFSVISQAPGSFDDLAAAFAVGKYSDPQLASLLTGAPVFESPARSLLLGNRVLSYSGQAGLTYAMTPRLNFHFTSFTAAGQTRFGSTENTTAQNYVMPRTLGANGGVGFSYSLSPRTQVGLAVEENRTVNHFQSAYASTANASLGRKMGMHWFLRVYAGGAYITVTQQSVGTPKTKQIIGGGSLGFQTYSHTLTGSYDRQASDAYGFAVGTITTINGSWSWRHPGSTWNMFAGYTDQQTRSTGFVSLSGWQASAGISKHLSASTALTAQYTYLNSAGTYPGALNQLSVHSVRLSLGWAPPQRR